MKDGTFKMIRKAALQVGFPVLLVFIACNAYLAVKHLRKMHRIAALTEESSLIQANIAAVLKDLTDMETGQRGYLLTGDDSYLQPYNEAKARMVSDVAALRSGLSLHTKSAPSLESQLESLAESKQAEMEQTIDLRQKGYRHRAFMRVKTNEGAEYMDEARKILSSLSGTEAGSFARLEQERSASLRSALAEIVIANSLLLVITACLFGLIRYRGQLLEQENARSRQELTLRDLQLEKLMSVLSNQARSQTYAIEAKARLLLENYGGFLPRQGHECAEQIKEASSQMEQLRQELVAHPGSNGAGNAA